MLALGQGVPKDLKLALEWYQKSAEGGDAHAQSNLAPYYLSGEGVPVDYGKAVSLYEKSIAQGNSDAIVGLGLCYQRGQGVKQDASKALEYFKKSADQNNAYAMGWLGLSYENGWGVSRNGEEALKWYLKALQIAPDVVTYHNLASLYNSGELIPKNEVEAARNYKVAADMGYWSSQMAYAKCLADGFGVEKDLSAAVEWYSKAAKQGHPEALLEQAITLSKMDDDESQRQSAELIDQLVKSNYSGAFREKAMRCVKDPAEAFALLAKAADLGDSQAMTALGDCHAKGTGVPRNPSEAASWYRKAAEKDNADGQYAYAICLLDGIGVEKNNEEGMKLLHTAMGKNQRAAQLKQAQLFLRESPPKTTEAFELFKKSADQDNADAQYEMGLCYENGTGTEKNPLEAFNWYKKSARGGNVNGQVAYGKCLLNGTGVTKSKGMATYWLRMAAQQGNEEAKKLLKN